MIQQQLRQVGVDVRPAFRDPGAQAALLAAGDFDAALAAWGIDTGLDLRHAFHSGPAGEDNWGGYASPQVDRLLDAIAAVPERGEALPLYHDLQRRLHEDQPYTFLWEPQWLVGIAERVRGATPNPLRTFDDLHRWRLAPAPAARR